MAIKIAAGKLTLGAPFDEFVELGCERWNRFLRCPRPVPRGSLTLPPHHRDPFDRLIVATAQEEI